MKQRRKLFQGPYRVGPAQPRVVSFRPKTTPITRGSDNRGNKTKMKYSPNAFDSDAKLRRHIDNLKVNSLKNHQKPTFDNVSKFIADEKKSKDYRVKTSVGVNFHVGKITPPAGLGGEEDGKHIHVTSDVKVKTVVLGTDPIEVYSRKIETGVPSSKALLEVAKENGTTTEVLFDTKTSLPTDKEFLSRKQLTFGTGFNQKGLTVFGDNSYVSYEDIRKLTMSATGSEAMPLNKLQTQLGSFLTSRVEIALRNQSAYLRAHVKVHLVTHKPGTTTLEGPVVDLASNVFYADMLSTNEVTQRTKVPVAFQYTPVALETGNSAETAAPNNAMHVDFAPDVNLLNYSPYFKDHFEIVGTVGQILGPGDFLNFTHIHHFGKGFDMGRIYAAAANPIILETLRNRQTSYFYMIEYKGFPCEVTLNNGGQYEHHLGTNPVILSSELRKKLVFCNTDRSTEDLGGTGVSQKVHMRVFDNVDKQIDVSRKKFNLNLADWTTLGTPPDGKYVLQIATDRSVKSDVHVGGNTNSTDIVP